MARHIHVPLFPFLNPRHFPIPPFLLPSLCPPFGGAFVRMSILSSFCIFLSLFTFLSTSYAPSLPSCVKVYRPFIFIRPRMSPPKSLYSLVVYFINNVPHYLRLPSTPASPLYSPFPIFRSRILLSYHSLSTRLELA